MTFGSIEGLSRIRFWSFSCIKPTLPLPTSSRSRSAAGALLLSLLFGYFVQVMSSSQQCTAVILPVCGGRVWTVLLQDLDFLWKVVWGLKGIVGSDLKVITSERINTLGFVASLYPRKCPDKSSNWATVCRSSVLTPLIPWLLERPRRLPINFRRIVIQLWQLPSVPTKGRTIIHCVSSALMQHLIFLILYVHQLKQIIRLSWIFHDAFDQESVQVTLNLVWQT